MGLRWQLELDRVAWLDLPASGYCPHDSGQADDVAIGIGMQGLLEQSVLEVVDLLTRIPQPGHGDNHVTDHQPGTDGKLQEVDATSGDVLAHVPGTDAEAGLCHFVEQLRVDQVHLAKIRL